MPDSNASETQASWNFFLSNLTAIQVLILWLPNLYHRGSLFVYLSELIAVLSQADTAVAQRARSAQRLFGLCVWCMCFLFS
eukprot:m.169297 g.169297  ORF g.169297 m.169297 type:complete len:81 (+) comp21185_c0_seq5:414-656(+)